MSVHVHLLFAGVVLKRLNVNMIPVFHIRLDYKFLPRIVVDLQYVLRRPRSVHGHLFTYRKSMELSHLR